jgi:ribonuclease Z
MADFMIHTLGCGSAKPTPRHNPSSTVVEFRNNLFMVDCGEGTQKAFQRQRLKISRLGHIFLTHLHGDHVLGLPGLVSTLGLQDTGGSLTIHTFAEGAVILKKIFDFFARNLPYKIQFNILSPWEEDIAFENQSLRVRTVPLDHRVPTVGYIFEEKPRPRHLRRDMCDFHGVPVRCFNNIKEGADYIKPDGTLIRNAMLTTPPDPSLSYAHISDTIFLPELAEEIGPVDLLFHETTYLERDAALAAEYGHSTARQAAEMARLCGAKALLTGHYSSRYADDEEFVKEASAIFPNTLLNHEGLRTDLLKL